MEVLKESTALTDMISYQEGSVVSRTLIDKKAGTITLFAFDKEQGLSEHKAPFDALVNVLDGEAIVSIGGEPHTVKTGEAIILPVDVVHSLKAKTQFKMMLVMIREQ